MFKFLRVINLKSAEPVYLDICAINTQHLYLYHFYLCDTYLKAGIGHVRISKVLIRIATNQIVIGSATWDSFATFHAVYDTGKVLKRIGRVVIRIGNFFIRFC